jgi:integrase
MLRALADVIGTRPSAKTIAGLIDRYELYVIPTKSESTQRDQCRQLKNLRRAFGHMDPRALRQPHAIQYRDKRAERAPTAANREMELLSHICSMGVEWGAMDFNPLRNMRKLKRPPRDRYVTNAEYLRVWELASPMVQCVLDLAMLTGLRRGDIFRLERKHITNDGIVIRPGKTLKTTGQTILFEWSPDLRAVVHRALSLPPQVRQHIVCNRKGKPFTKNGFDSVWQRLMAKATSGDNSIQHFQFRDLRRKSATDEGDERAAQARLGHSSSRITKQVYRVKPVRVRPLR